MNMYTNMNYFKFLKDFATFSSCFHEDYMNSGDEKSMTMNSILKKEENIYYKILSVIDDNDGDDDSVDENDNDENNITNKENFEQIYNK